METTEKKLTDIYQRAKKCTNKGRMYVYESYKQELRSLNLSSADYGEACRKIANFLRV